MKNYFVDFALWQLREVREPYHATAVWEIVTIPLSLLIIWSVSE